MYYPSDIVWPKVGVYALWLKGEVRYIGQTGNLPNRLYKHKKDGRKFDAVWWQPVALSKLDETEAWLIQQVRPSENIRIPEWPIT